MNISKKTRRMLELGGKVLMGAGRRLYQSPMEKRVIPWFRDQGDKTHRLDYSLDENSVVFDLGGYEGQWSSDLFSRYSCQIHIFEPVKEYAQGIRARFACNQKIHVHEFGLSDKDSEIRIGKASDASSSYHTLTDYHIGHLRNASKFLSETQIEFVDLMKINIEGGEYDLLDFLLDQNLVTRIANIQIQFHDFVPDAPARMASIQDRLRKTHHLTYQYHFVWENWALNIE